MSNVITREFKGQMFTFREDGYFNMTEAAKNFGKEAKEFLRLPSTIEYMREMENVGFSHLFEVIRGRTGGTWGHPKLAVFFARWLSPAFAVFCDAVIDDILNKKATLTIDKPEESFAVQVPKSLPEALRMAADLAEKNEKLQHERDGVVNTIGQSLHTINRVVRMFDGVNVNAIKSDLKELGYLYKRPNGAYRVYRKYSDLFVEKFHEVTGNGDIFVTAEGKALLGRLYSEGKLTLKKGFKTA